MGERRKRKGEWEECRGYSTNSLGTWKHGALGSSESYCSGVFSLCYSLVHGEVLEEQSSKVQQCNVA